MSVFFYRGLDRAKTRVRGTITADTPRQARELLREQGVIVQNLDQTTDQNRRSLQANLLGRSARQRWPDVAHEMSMLLSTGISLTDALDTLSQQHDGRLRRALQQLRDAVVSGSSLAEAMAMQPDVFDTVSTRLVEVGENTGALDKVLSELSDFKSQAAEFRDRITTALMYPVFLFVMGLAAMVFLMTWVMPPLLESLEETLPALPLPTRIAQTASQTLVSHGMWLGIVLLVAILASSVWSRTDAGRKAIQRSIMRLPWLGPLYVKQSVARVALVLGLLLRSGVLLTDAMRLAAESSTNLIYRDVLHSAEEALTRGEDLAEALGDSRGFPTFGGPFLFSRTRLRSPRTNALKARC